MMRLRFFLPAIVHVCPADVLIKMSAKFWKDKKFNYPPTLLDSLNSMHTVLCAYCTWTNMDLVALWARWAGWPARAMHGQH